MKDDREKPDQRLTVWQVIKSILAAAFGVQTEEARARDFTRGSPAAFIVGGIVFTVLFVVILVLVVNLILRSAGVS